MLNYRNARLALVASVALIGALNIAGGVSLWWLVMPAALYLGAISYGSAVVSSSFYLPTLCAGPGTRPVIALTFDDGPVEATKHILEVLKQHQVTATFFCIGQRVQQNPGVLQQIDAAGHVIGNHSLTHHPLLDFFSRKRLTAELQETSSIVSKTIGKKPRLFRPPYGVTTPNLAFAVKRLGFSCIGWSVRSMDTVVKDEQKLLANMVLALKPGAVFLFHDTSATTAAILDDFIREVKKRGFTINPVHQLVNETPYV